MIEKRKRRGKSRTLLIENNNGTHSCEESDKLYVHKQKKKEKEKLKKQTFNLQDHQGFKTSSD